MLKRGWVFALAVILSFGMFTFYLSREDFSLRRIKQPGVIVGLSESFVMGQLESLFQEMALEAEAEREEFEKLLDLPPDAVLIGIGDMDPVGLEKALADTPWGRLRDLMKAVRMHCSEDVQHKVILFLLQKANPEESPYIRKAAEAALQLFPLDSEQRTRVLCYFEAAYKTLVEQGMPITGYFKVISGFIPKMSEEEISALSQPFLTLIAFYCADNLLESDVEILSRVIKYLEPSDQKTALISLLSHFLGEDNEAYRRVFSLSVVDLFVNNLPHCQNEDFLDAAFKWAVVLLDSPGTRERGKDIKEALRPCLNAKLMDILDKH